MRLVGGETLSVTQMSNDPERLTEFLMENDLSLSDVVSTELARLSLMAEGLLLDATQRRNLVADLMGDEQASLPAGPSQ